MKRRIFDRQFKIEAVRLACSADMTVTQTARTLNISSATLYRWIAEGRMYPRGKLYQPGNHANNGV